jgi:hypothetical protein
VDTPQPAKEPQDDEDQPQSWSSEQEENQAPIELDSELSEYPATALELISRSGAERPIELVQELSEAGFKITEEGIKMLWELSRPAPQELSVEEATDPLTWPMVVQRLGFGLMILVLLFKVGSIK